MVDFSELTPENINMFAMKHYDNPSCVDEAEFLDDMKRFRYLKRLFRKYDTSGELKLRLIINHIIILSNVFGVDATTTLLFFKIEVEHWSLLKTFLVYLHFMPENDLVEVPINHNARRTRHRHPVNQVVGRAACCQQCHHGIDDAFFINHLANGRECGPHAPPLRGSLPPVRANPPWSGPAACCCDVAFIVCP